MRHVWRLATRNWSASPGCTMAIMVAVAVGVAAVLTTTSLYEMARRSVVEDVVQRWLGAAHLTVYAPGGHWGGFEAGLLPEIKSLEGVAHVAARLTRRMRLVRPHQAEELIHSGWLWVDAVGVDPAEEWQFRTLPYLEGRLLNPNERGAALIERETAELFRSSRGQGRTIALTHGPGEPVMELNVVGDFPSLRAGEFQRPNVILSLTELQEFLGQPGSVSSLDIMLTDPTGPAITRTESALRRLVEARNLGGQLRVESAAGRLELFSEADRIGRMMLTIVSVTVMATVFFQIVTTAGVSLFARRTSLGIMRCVGMTRGQLSQMVCMEVMTAGFAAALIGLPLGIGVMHTICGLLGESTRRLCVAPWNLALAWGSGFVALLVAVVLLIFQAIRVTPLEATRTHALPASRGLMWLAGVAGILMLGWHEVQIRRGSAGYWEQTGSVILAVVSLNLGYALLVPAVVVSLGSVIARSVALVLGVNTRLAGDQIGRVPWRVTGGCWVLMTGLSVIVYLAANARALVDLWDFPARLPDVFVWSPDYVESEVVERVRRIPAVGRITTTTDVDCALTARSTRPAENSGIMANLLRRLTRPVFVAGDPESLLDIMKITFLEGNMEDARRKLARGGHLLIPTQAARNYGVGLGDRITVSIGERSFDFEIAGVIQSPPLDIAVTAFQATTYMQFAAASAVLGTQRDLKERFGLDVVSMILCNLDLVESPPPAEFDPLHLPEPADTRGLAEALLEWAPHIPEEHDTLLTHQAALRTWLDGPLSAVPGELEMVLRRMGVAVRRVRRDAPSLSKEDGWALLRERLVLAAITTTMERPDAVYGSVRRLKENIVRGVHRAVTTVTWLPSFLLIVGAIGIGNLMSVGVRMRARQLAMLRAVGAWRSQVVRLVLVEAVTIALIGGLLGVVLGEHGMWSDRRLTAQWIGLWEAFIVPTKEITMGVVVCIVVCVAAGIPSAWRASRASITTALQSV